MARQKRRLQYKSRERSDDFQVTVAHIRGKTSYFNLIPNTPDAVLALCANGLRMPLERLPRNVVCEYLGLCATEYSGRIGRQPTIDMNGINAGDKTYIRSKLRPSTV